MYGTQKGEQYEKYIPYHKCTAEDFDEFAPPAPEAEYLLEKYMTNDNDQNLFCLDWDQLGENLAIWGVELDEESY